MAKAKQFVLLLWKNYVLQKRKKIVTIFEIALPTFFALILIFIRMRVVAKEIKEVTAWSAFPVNHLPDTLCPNNPYCHLYATPWKLYYTPNNNLTQSMMSHVKTALGSTNISRKNHLSMWKTGVGVKSAYVSGIYCQKTIFVSCL